MIRILATIFAALFGLAFGSFLNVCLSRWPAGESIVKPGSHCRNCDHTLSWWENLPLLSWIILRGRCRNCKTAISWRYPLVELVVSVLWAILAWHESGDTFAYLRDPSIFIFFPMSRLIGGMAFSWMMVALAILDAENLWLPDSIAIPGIILGLLLDTAKAFVQAISPWYNIIHAGNSPAVLRGVGHETLLRLLEILAAAALILLIRWLYKRIRHREGIGLGDAKLMALLAAWLGLPGALLAFALGAVIGAITALALLILPRKPQADAPTWAATKLPLGTFLCIGGIISALWGQPIISAYLHWAGF
jgi:leader peptidase (prepilin peptidase) / N-methyltransferase